LIGLEAIEQYNGWAMASIGASIVFLGLILLSLAVWLFGKIESSLDRFRKGSASGSSNGAVPDSPKLSREAQAAIRQLRLIVDRIGDPFPLPKLLELAGKAGMMRAQATAGDALDAQIIVPDGSGSYTWDMGVFQEKVGRGPRG